MYLSEDLNNRLTADLCSSWRCHPTFLYSAANVWARAFKLPSEPRSAQMVVSETQSSFCLLSLQVSFMTSIQCDSIFSPRQTVILTNIRYLCPNLFLYSLSPTTSLDHLPGLHHTVYSTAVSVWQGTIQKVRVWMLLNDYWVVKNKYYLPLFHLFHLRATCLLNCGANIWNYF